VGFKLETLNIPYIYLLNRCFVFKGFQELKEIHTLRSVKYLVVASDVLD